MKYHYYRSIRDQKINKVSELKKGAWIFAHTVDADEMKELIDYGFDEALLEDATDYFEVPRFEYENGINYLYTRYIIDTKDGELSTAPLLIAISETNVLTLSPRKPEFLDDFAHGRKDITTTQKNKMVLTFLESIMHDYHKSIMQIRRLMLRYFADVGNISEQEMKRFVGLESTLADYISALAPTNLALSMMLTRHKSLTLHEEDIELLEDLKQDINQLLESSKSVSKTIGNIRSAHEGILTHKLNLTIKTLTMVTITLTVPTLITSFFGMNTWLPFDNGPVGFVVVIILIALVTFGVLKWLMKNYWK
ncbi:MAG: magnesium transporter CorA family protein [Candidatus Pacebacteria bacterium]|nr:magnesium transporter CorA family protein [Candidatus Paceibacterota bacterium]